jgi:hypothetical protein
VPSAGVVEILAPGGNDLAALISGGEVVPGQHLVFQRGEERLRGSILEARSDPAHPAEEPGHQIPPGRRRE